MTARTRQQHARQTRRALGWLALMVLTVLAVVTVPEQVNAAGYAVGAGQTVSFVPQSYQDQPCTAQGGCSTSTVGVLRTTPPVTVVWPGEAPLGRPFPVRQPVWKAPWGADELYDGSRAAFYIVLGLILDAAAAFLVTRIVLRVRRRLRARRDPLSGIAAGM